MLIVIKKADVMQQKMEEEASQTKRSRQRRKATQGVKDRKSIEPKNFEHEKIRVSSSWFLLLKTFTLSNL